MAAKTLMIQGTGSGVGKSVIVAGLCRILKQDGYRVAPFKSQNMALNSFVTPDGLEIGRAQAFQAEAAGLEPMIEMNPVLLKPGADNCSQVIVMGKPIGNRDAQAYYKENLKPCVLEAFAKMQKMFDVILLEGAGSPAEINLRDNDIVNMWMARQAEAPVLIAGDIDKGGVFAWMKGTFDLLRKDEKERVKGFIINKFRGDIKLLEPGVKMFEKMVQRPVIGTLPFYHDITVDEEDALPLDPVSFATQNAEKKIHIAVVKTPRLSNFTDFTPLQHETDVHLQYVAKPEEIQNADAVILPGSKSTIADWLFLRRQNWPDTLKSHVAQGKMLIGICAGFQILGSIIRDPLHIESSLKEIAGLGFFKMETELLMDKTTVRRRLQTRKNALIQTRCHVDGYEIHMGKTTLQKEHQALLEESAQAGLVTQNGRVWGTYLHGIFDNDAFRRQFLNFLLAPKGGGASENNLHFARFRQEQFDKLASLLRAHLNMAQIYDFIF